MGNSLYSGSLSSGRPDLTNRIRKHLAKTNPFRWQYSQFPATIVEFKTGRLARPSCKKGDFFPIMIRSFYTTILVDSPDFEEQVVKWMKEQRESYFKEFNSKCHNVILHGVSSVVTPISNKEVAVLRLYFVLKNELELSRKPRWS